MKNHIAVAAALFAMAAGSAAQAHSWAVELNGAKMDELKGAEVGFGRNLEFSKLRVTPMVGAFIYRGDNDRYRRETFANGATVCRDLTNGRFSDKENCDNTAVKGYGKLEGAFRFTKSFELGGGVRVGGGTQPYATASVFLTNNVAIKAFGSKDYYGAGLSPSF